jgi:hypothetical protein
VGIAKCKWSLKISSAGRPFRLKFFKAGRKSNQIKYFRKRKRIIKGRNKELLKRWKLEGAIIVSINKWFIEEIGRTNQNYKVITAIAIIIASSGATKQW